MKVTEKYLENLGYIFDAHNMFWCHPEFSDYPVYDVNRNVVRNVEYKTDDSRTQVGGDHYGRGIDCIDFIEANDIPFLEGNVIKYVYRHASKNGVEDIDKAISYLNRIKLERYNADNK